MRASEMTLRIFEDRNTNDNETVVALHGWLSAAEVEELARVVAGKDPSLRIDLAQLAGVGLGGPAGPEATAGEGRAAHRRVALCRAAARPIRGG